MKTKSKKIEEICSNFSALAVAQMTGMYSHYRTTLIEELSDDELTAMYQSCFPSEMPLQKQLVKLRLQDIMKRKRSVILTIATETGIKAPDDWTAFNNWMLHSSKFKKPLKNHNLEELEALHKQMRALQSNYEHSAEKVGNKAWFHKHKLPQPSKN